MSPVTAFYLQDGPDRVLSQPSTAGPWGPDSQHGGPPAALLGRAIEGLVPDGSRTVGRVTIELLGPVPVGPLRVIDIVGLDRQADGGTHLLSTAEVGSVRVVGTESKGKDNKRIRLEVVGPDEAVRAIS